MVPSSPQQTVEPAGAGPCDLFRRVQKRDGRIVDFDPTNITNAIYSAAQSVDGKDRRRAETLTEYVILDLARQHQASTNLLNIEDIQNSIERVLMENGHYRTARAFITYRNERARRRRLRGETSRPLPEENNNTTLLETSVWTSTGRAIRWNRERIVQALVRETALPYEEARQVSHEVEMEIIHSKISHLTAPLIRELTNAKLLQMGYEKQRRLHARLGVPVYDVEQRVYQPGASGSSLENSVESEILRQFALEKVLPLESSQAHAALDIHFHDLSLIHRPLDLKRDLGFIGTKREASLPALPFLEMSGDGWETFLTEWQRVESELLPVCGKRLVWENVNTALAFQVHQSEQTAAQIVAHALARLWRPQRAERPHKVIAWRLNDAVLPRWRARFAGLQQLSLLPDDEVDALNRSVLLELLRQLEAAGPYWLSCGVEFEVVLHVAAGQGPETTIAQAISRCLANQVPLRVLFHRETAVADSAATDHQDLANMVSLNLSRALLVAKGNPDKALEWLDERLNLVVEAHRAKHNLLTNILKQGALSPLVGAERSASKIHQFTPAQAIYGVGVCTWEDLRASQGKPADSEPAELREYLRLLARLQLRLREIGERVGLNLQITATTETGVLRRFAEDWAHHTPLTKSSEIDNMEAGEQERLLAIGKGHPFLAFGHGFCAFDMEPDSPPQDWERKIHYLATETHCGGLTWEGRGSFCGECWERLPLRQSVCHRCESEQVYRFHRSDKGNHSTFSRL